MDFSVRGKSVEVFRILFLLRRPVGGRRWPMTFRSDGKLQRKYNINNGDNIISLSFINAVGIATIHEISCPGMETIRV